MNINAALQVENQQSENMLCGVVAHDIDSTGVKVIDRESKEFFRRVLEAIQIESKGPNLVRDKGLDLDPVWDTLLQKRGGAK